MRNWQPCQTVHFMFVISLHKLTLAWNRNGNYGSIFLTLLSKWLYFLALVVANVHCNFSLRLEKIFIFVFLEKLKYSIPFDRGKSFNKTYNLVDICISSFHTISIKNPSSLDKTLQMGIKWRCCHLTNNARIMFICANNLFLSFALTFRCSAKNSFCTIIF